MISIEQAIEEIIRNIVAIQAVETVSLDEALGRVCAQDIQSTIAVPPFANSAMDGVVANSQNIREGHDYPVSQRIPAGTAPTKLTPNTVARIFTGAVMPEGADAVVIQENCQFNESQVRILKQPKAHDNVRAMGQDIKQGDVVVQQGTGITAAHLGLLASVGCRQIPVFKKLKVAIVSTGNELVEPGQPLQAGQIYNSNRPMLIGLCQKLGMETLEFGIVADTYEATIAALKQAAEQADFILSSGGVSVGEEDHVKHVVAELGELNLWKIKMKPGKPVAFGHVLGTPILGLPGNPVSSYVTFMLIARPALQARQGVSYKPPKCYSVKTGFTRPLVSRQEYLRVKLNYDEAGLPVAQLYKNQSSGVLSSICWADGLVIHPADSSIKQGQTVLFLPYD